jgi:thiamine pyrophosphate-dependent acetolactate synthase large subunit-like protein
VKDPSEIVAGVDPALFTETDLTSAQMQDLASRRPVGNFQSRFGENEPRKGADILVEALEREGVDCVFAYPGGASMEIHQSLTKSATGVRNVLCRHEQGEVFAAEGYAKCTGKVGVCIATSGPGATNLVTGLADALLDSVPLVAITGQGAFYLTLVPVRPRRRGERRSLRTFAGVSLRPGSLAFNPDTPRRLSTPLLTPFNSTPPSLCMERPSVPRRMIGTDAFQETPTVEITRQITKHNYLVMNVEDIPRVVREAFFLASSGRPGPVLIDIPKDVQQQMSIPFWGPKVSLNGYLSRLPSPPTSPQMQQVLDMIKRSKRPVVYAGGGCLDAAPELKEFVDATGIPTTTTLMGLGAYPASGAFYTLVPIRPRRRGERRSLRTFAVVSR